MGKKLTIHTNPVVRVILIIAGWILVALGFIGMFLPVMPTTIFWILSAACFARSSEKFYNWVINNKRFGKFIRDFYEKRGITLKGKIISIGMMNLAIICSVIFAVKILWVKIVMLAVSFLVSIYILSLNTIREDDNTSDELQET